MKQDARTLVVTNELRGWEARENELIQDKLNDMKSQRDQLVKPFAV